MSALDSDARSDTVLTFAGSHLAWLGSIVAVLSVGVKALLVSRFDVATAGLLVQTTGPTAVFLGAITTGWVPILFLMLLVSIAWRTISPGLGSASLTNVVLVVSTVVVPWPGYLTLLALTFILPEMIGRIAREWSHNTLMRTTGKIESLHQEVDALAGEMATLQTAVASAPGEAVQVDLVSNATARMERVRRDLKRLDEERAEWKERADSGWYKRQLIYLLATPVITFALLTFLFNPNMWLPKEAIAPTGGAPFVGYVLRSSSDGLVVMRDGDRSIVQSPAGLIRDHQICSSTSGAMPSVYQLLAGYYHILGPSPTYPACPS